MLSAKDQNMLLPESAVEENVVVQKKIQSARPRARRGRGKKRQEAPSSTPQVGGVHLTFHIDSVTCKGYNTFSATALSFDRI